MALLHHLGWLFWKQFFLHEFPKKEPIGIIVWVSDLESGVCMMFHGGVERK
jgi:hypothetical protein